MSPEEVAAKRRVLVGALTSCFEHSRVKEVVPLESIRSILQSASSELWREGEFRLEMVWKVLCQQPGISPQDVAPPLLVFKSLEADLEVSVRLPPALSALPPAEQAKLRDQVSLTRDAFLAQVPELAATPPPPEVPIDTTQAAQAAVEATEPPRPTKKPLALGAKVAIGALAVLSLCAAGGSTWWALRDPTQTMMVDDLASVLLLTGGKRVDGSMSARLSDPRWETLSREEQRRLAARVFDHEREKGIKVLTLLDASGRVRVSASDATGRTTITIH
jgi:hypothetical protein